ncbi:MAG: choice-of-anchor J domain-containing protein [Muribaculaceae bacterium]|nr:choice-of-anchor J domain-containing protein [Muribaculaceae bacterium]
MRQKLLFSLVALALGVFSSANAQNSLTVYAGDATSAYVPVYGFYCDAFQKVEMIMNANDLEEMTGGTITNITWYLASPAAEAWGGNFKIYLKEVNEAAPAGYDDLSNAVLVYEGPLDGTSEKLGIEFSTPYTYEGGNLLIAVHQVEKGTYKSATFSGMEVTGAAIQGYSYNAVDQVNSAIRDFLPQTMFDYTPGGGVIYYKPKNLQVSDITLDGATLTWEPGNDETAWNVEYKKSIDEDWIAAGSVSAPTYTLEDLTNGVGYDVRVQGDYGSGNLSGWTETSFATLACEESDMGEVEYTLTDTYGDGWNNNKLQVYLHGTNVMVQELTITHVSGNPNEDNLLEGTFKLCYGVDYDLVWVAGSYPYETGFVLTGPEGETIYEFHGTGSSSGDVPPAGVLTTFQIHMNTCPRPTNVAASNVTYNGATLTWTPGAPEQDLWQVIYAAGNVAAEAIDMVPIDVSEPTYALTGLEENTTYSAYVRSKCSEDDQSRWSVVCTFATPLQFPIPADLEITDITAKSATANWTGEAQSYNFRYRMKTGLNESFEAEEAPAGWTLNNWMVMPIYQYTMGGTPLAAAEGNSCLASKSMDDTGSSLSPLNVDNWLISPKVDLAGTLEFYVGDLGADYAENFSVYVSTTGTATTDFTAIAENVATAGAMVTDASAWAKKEFDLSAYEGQQGFIAIRHHNAEGYYLFVDAMKIAGENVPEGEWTVMEGVTPPVNMEGLAPLTTYEAQAQGIYDDGLSQWCDIVNFTTLDAAAMPEELTVPEVDITATSAKVEWIGSQDTYNLRYREAAINSGVAEDFEEVENGGLPEGWTVIDADGDGYNWAVWVLNKDDGTTQVTLSSNSYVNYVGALTPDNWVITPQTKLGSQVSFDAWGQDPSYAAEHFQVYVSTGQPVVADFVAISDEIIATGDVTNYSFDLGEYAGKMGYVAIRHFNVTDQYILNVKNFYMTGDGDTPAGEWVVVNNVTSPYVIKGLKPETKYEVQVQGVVNRELTDWTPSVFFTTTGAQFYVCGGFNGWNAVEPLVIDPENGASIELVEDANDSEWNQFKILTNGEDDWLWLGGIDENGVGYFDVTEGMLADGTEITLDDEGSNFKLPAAGKYIIKMVAAEEGDGKAPFAGFKMVVSKDETPGTAIFDINGKTVLNVKYVNLAGIESDKPFDGVNIVVTTFTDGTKATSKVIK